MAQTPLWVLPILIFLVLPVSMSEDENVRNSLVKFMEVLSSGNMPRNANSGWNMTSDPCIGNWTGVSCYPNSQAIRRIVLDAFNLTGTLDAGSVCMTPMLVVLSLNGNKIQGAMPETIGNCRHLTHLFVGGNKFNGNLPKSLSQLNNLKRLDISNNNFSGELPDLVRISGLVTFLAQDNQLTGAIPNFDFLNFKAFNVSNNNFTGPIPDVKGKFMASSFAGNPGLCGNSLSAPCQQPSTPLQAPPSPIPPSMTGSKHSVGDQLLKYSGYIILAVVLLLLIAIVVIKKRKHEQVITTIGQKERNASKSATNSSSKSSNFSSELKTTTNRSEYSVTSSEYGLTSPSLVFISSPKINGLRFQDLLRAPAELLGRGKYGSLYKVMLDNGMALAVKRIKDWDIKQDEFKRRMQRIQQVKHPRVLPPIALYSSQQEKLLVYEYQPNGSLFKLLHGSQNGKKLGWGSRLSVAATIAEALAFMHEELREDDIAHGNLKSTNIIFNNNMEPCISEYGLMQIELTRQESTHTQTDSEISRQNSILSQTDSFAFANVVINQTGGNDKMSKALRDDVYSFGVMLLELLTGKMVQNGSDLASWVHSVVREEWTVEVFDRTLVSEGASEDRMVHLLQVALKCINPSSQERPNMNQVASMINAIKEDEEESSIASSHYA